MKKLLVILGAGVVITTSSCKKYFDINTNPNQATSATPQLVLPLALTATASNISQFNDYGSQLVGYQANAGGYGGFGVAVTYAFGASNYGGLWNTSYDILEDFQSVIDASAANMPALGYFNAVGKIMKAYNFELLVDTYNDVPYTNALKGSSDLLPTYDAGAVVYDSLANLLDDAIAVINDVSTQTGITPLGSSDVIFDGDMTKWKQLANTIKLRLMIHAGDKVNFANKSFDDAGFLTDDALINPGYTRDNGRQNPQWNGWAYSYTGTAGNKAWLPNTFVFGYYNGVKLTDSLRGVVAYYQFPNTGNNRLGAEGTGVVSSPNEGGSFWYSGEDRVGTSAGNSTGILKGPNAGMPLFLAAESYFLQSEAVVRGMLTSSSTAAQLFDNGIEASYIYLYKLPTGAVSADADASTFIATYKADNPDSYLVNFDKATTQDQQVEAIITQKYIALNFIHGNEAWNEYRRTHYPVISNAASANGYETFASTQSQSTRPDRLPTRILYPSVEGSYNTANVPKNISPYTSLIFWAQ